MGEGAKRGLNWRFQQSKTRKSKNKLNGQKEKWGENWGELKNGRSQQCSAKVTEFFSDSERKWKRQIEPFNFRKCYNVSCCKFEKS